MQAVSNSGGFKMKGDFFKEWRVHMIFARAIETSRNRLGDPELAW